MTTNVLKKFFFQISHLFTFNFARPTVLGPCATHTAKDTRIHRRLRFILLFNSRSNSGGPVGGGKDGGGGGGDGGERGEHARSAEVRFLVQSPFRHIAERAHTHTYQTLRSRFSVYTPCVFSPSHRLNSVIRVSYVRRYDFRKKKNLIFF